MSVAKFADPVSRTGRFTEDRHWDRAVRSGAFPTPFQTAAWYDAWTESAGARAGVVPRIFRLPATGPIRLGLAMQLETLPDGQSRLSPLSAPWSDYQDAIGEGATPGDLDEAADWLRTEAATTGARLCCDDVVPGGLLESILARLAGRFRRSTPVVAVDLRDPARIARLCERREHAAKRRRLARIGAISLRHNRRAADVAAAFARFVALHRRQWAGRDDAVAPFTDDSVLETFETVAQRCAAAGCLTISELRCGDDTIASYFGFHLGGRYFGYRTAFDQDLYALSPGHILLQEMLRDFARHGLAHFDLMRGGYAYKSAYGSRFGHNLAWGPAEG